jgi:hypothetical protein
MLSLNIEKKDYKGKKGGQSEAICSLNETEVVRGEKSMDRCCW